MDSERPVRGNPDFAATSGAERAELMLTELPHEPPAGDPSWCENYCFDLHDPTVGISMWLHLSRSQLDLRLWREVVNVFLPDGRIGMWKGYGTGHEVRERPTGPTLAVDVVEPFEHLRLTAVGVVRLTDEAELRAGPLCDDVEVSFALDVDWCAATPVWDMRNQLDGQIWASGHYEQGAAISGSVKVDGETWALSGTGWRDHSVGPRNNGLMRDHDWAHAVFPSGRAFAIFRHARVGVGEDLGGAFVSVDGRQIEASLVSVLPRVAGVEDAGPIEIVLSTPSGPTTITAENLNTAWSGSAPPAHQTLGRRTRSGHLRWESQTRYSWDGETALGIFERTMRLP